MSHFDIKSLAFYGVAITSVVVLFKGVSAYGEKNLTAPAAIAGSYLIDLGSAPACLQTELLKLTLQQSGVYLTAALEPISDPAVSQAPAQSSLSGRFKDQQVAIAGQAPLLKSCTADEATPAIAITGSADGTTLTGQLTLDLLAQPIEFTAEREPFPRGEE